MFSSQGVPRSFVQRLAKYFDLKAWMEDLKPKPKLYGSNEFALKCPVCEKDEKLWVNLEKRIGWCYFCEATYDVIKLVTAFEHCTTLRLIEILKTHGHSATLDLRQEIDRVLGSLEALSGDWQEEKLPTIALPEGFTSAVEEQRLPPYFKERGISWNRAIHYDLGWTLTGFYENRLIVPVKQSGEMVTFHARYMEKQPPKGVKKVLYPKGTKTSRMLFNIDRAASRDRVVLCEDVFSAMAVGASGMATFGTSLSKYQLAMLLTTDAKEVIVLWDRDAISKAYTLAESLVEHWQVRVVELPDERDPDEYKRSEVWRMIDSARPIAAGTAFSAKIRARLSENS